jgi:hypothetical protein
VNAERKRLDHLIELAQKPSKSKLEGRQIAVWIPKALADRFVSRAKGEGLPLKKVMAAAMAEYLAKREYEEASL